MVSKKAETKNHIKFIIMKTMKKTAIFIFTILLVGTTSTFAQRGRNFSGNEQTYGRMEYCERIPDLTEDQQQKIEALRVVHLKEMTGFRNQMDELRARKRTLMSSDADLKEVNTVIDQMTELQNKKMKQSAKHRQDVRNILTDEQKVYFDSMPRKGRGHGKGYARTGRGSGNCNYNGRGQGNGQGIGYGRGIN